MIIGGLELLTRIRTSFPGTLTRPVFPFLRVTVASDKFNNLNDEEREIAFATALETSVADLRSIGQRLFLRFDLLATSEDNEPLPASGETWLGSFSDQYTQLKEVSGAIRFIHFYGFKGGQGRTTLLAFTASELARDGQRILVVDLDAEAPSLDLVFGVGVVPPESSLVGLRAGLPIQALPIASPRGGGTVSLLAFRPTDAAFDLDATALAFEAAVYAPSQERLAAALKQRIAKVADVNYIHPLTTITLPHRPRSQPACSSPSSFR